MEVAYQSEIKQHTLLMAFARHLLYLVLDIKWRRYRELKPAFQFRCISGFLSGTMKAVAHGAGLRSSAIEMAVTDKHIRAWANFLDTDADYLICLEDDAVFRDVSKLSLGILLGSLPKKGTGRPMYIDLAGGCSLEALQIEKLQKAQDTAFRYYRKPVTNTACVYMMNRPLASAFYNVVTRRPWLRLIGVDWMMNALMMRITKDGVSCDCFHADPTIFKHGSTTGEYTAWIR